MILWLLFRGGRMKVLLYDQGRKKINIAHFQCQEIIITGLSPKFIVLSLRERTGGRNSGLVHPPQFKKNKRIGDCQVYV